jgi:hypothetical protein
MKDFSKTSRILLEKFRAPLSTFKTESPSRFRVFLHPRAIAPLLGSRLNPNP